MITAAEYLYLRCDAVFDVAGVRTGRTVTAKICEAMSADPADIGGLTVTASESNNAAVVEFLRADLLTDLASYIGKRVYLHVDDGVGLHDVLPLVVTDTDPSLLPPLTE